MSDSLAEVVQLQRAEEQANSTRVKWEFRMMRTVQRGRAVPLRCIMVRLPQPVYDALTEAGVPAVVARAVLVAWAQRLRR